MCNRIFADMAQLAEQLICNQQVIGSSPIIGFYGWIPEWPKGADCKSVGFAFEGSNPSPPIVLDVLVLSVALSSKMKCNMVTCLL